MTTVTGLTAERMLAIEGASVVDGEVNAGGSLILTKHDGSTIDAGPVVGPVGAPGAPGAQGPPGQGSIPGEIKMWPSNVLPAVATYGKWVWADGSTQLTASSPKAAANIDPVWRTFGGASDPGGTHFRVPDLRGLTPVGMDAMGGGARANRMTRAVAITLAGRAGEEMHVIQIAEMPMHNHGGGAHGHQIAHTQHEEYSLPIGAVMGGTSNNQWNSNPSDRIAVIPSPEIINNQGGGNAHENLQPTVFIPYIVCLTG
jgi:microcystin-dependent protein